MLFRAHWFNSQCCMDIQIRRPPLRWIPQDATRRGFARLGVPGRDFIQGFGCAAWKLMPLIQKQCAVCNKEFSVERSQISHGRGKCCSRSCSASLAAANRRSQFGPNNPNWKGGEIGENSYRDAKRRYRKRHPHKARAHMLVRDAIKRGDIVREPCRECGNDNSHAHHEDYDHPLDVVWLCKKHHEQRHIELNRLRKPE